MIFLFLRSVKAALVVGLAIPLSLTAALVALYLTGQTVNIMTLGGLALVIGTLLDNNIVVQENLHRHLEMGKDGRSAAEDSATELTLPIFVATICILIVYLPDHVFYRDRQVSLRPAGHDRRIRHAGGLCRLHVRDPGRARPAVSRGHGNGSEEEGSAAEGWFRYVLGIYEPVLQA